MYTNDYNSFKEKKFHWGLYLKGEDESNPIQLYSIDDIIERKLNPQYIIPYKTKKSYKQTYKEDLFRVCQLRYDIIPIHFKHLLFPEQLTRLERVSIRNLTPYIYINKVRIGPLKRLAAFLPEANYVAITCLDVEYNDPIQDILLRNMIERLLIYNQQNIYRVDLSNLIVIEGFLNLQGSYIPYRRINKYENTAQLLPLYIQRHIFVYNNYMLEKTELPKFKVVPA